MASGWDLGRATRRAGAGATTKRNRRRAIREGHELGRVERGASPPRDPTLQHPRCVFQI